MGRSRRPTPRRQTQQRTRWGWHQLDRKWAERLVDRANVAGGDLVLDIGAGTGALTAPLIERGARVIAVEMHAGRADALRRRFGSAVTVVEADASDLRLPRRPFVVVANPPFAITSALLLRLLQRDSRMTNGHLVVQRQAARRWITEGAPRYDMWGSRYELRTDLRIPRSAFRPRPTVDVSLLEISRRRPVAQRGRRPSGRREPDTPSS